MISSGNEENIEGLPSEQTQHQFHCYLIGMIWHVALRFYYGIAVIRMNLRDPAYGEMKARNAVHREDSLRKERKRSMVMRMVSPITDRIVQRVLAGEVDDDPEAIARVLREDFGRLDAIDDF